MSYEYWFAYQRIQLHRITARLRIKWTSFELINTNVLRIYLTESVIIVDSKL